MSLKNNIKTRGLQMAVQPAQKLHDVTVHAARNRPVNELVANLNLLDTAPAAPCDCRVAFRASIAQIRVKHIVLMDNFGDIKVREY
jgi:hypothetical protein